jgi:CBS domain-containing protein
MSDISAAGLLPITALVGDGLARIPGDATLHAVAEALTDQGIGALAVDDGDGRATSVVTERDLVLALAEHRDPAQTRAADIASGDLIRCSKDATVADVAELMMSRYVRHVFVEGEGTVVGIVSARDLLGVYAAADVEID